MKNIIEFLKKYNHLFLFVLLEVISAVLLFRFNSYQGSIWFTSANTVTAKVYEGTSAVEHYFSLTGVNEKLSMRNVVLEQQVSELREQLRQAGVDSTQIGFANDASVPAGLTVIPAHVVSCSVDRADNLMTIDKGSDDGVKPDMGVVCGQGIVGIVYQTSPHYSIVIPVISTRSNLSCSIEGRDYFGYLRWEKGSSRLAYLDNVPRHATFRLYERVVTSGFSSVFPRGVLVGKILHVYNSPDGLSYRMQLQLSTDFGRLRDVCVISDATAKERLELLRSAQDSIKLSKEGE